MHLADIHFDPQNARRHNSRNIGMIAESLQEFGPARSITIDELNVVLAGNGVVEAAAQIGVEHVRVFDRATGVLEPEPPGPHIFAVRVSGLSPEQKKLYAIADNRTTDLSDFAPEVLQAFMDEGLDLDQFWFPEELDAILNGDDEPFAGLTDPDDVPAIPDEPITKPGDVWLLGEHRVMCGDATRDIQALGRSDLVMTSPPYWVGKEYENEKTWEEVQSFIAVVAGNLATVMEKQGRIVINTGTTPASSLTGKRAHIKLLLDEWAEQLEHYGYLLRYARIWCKRGQLGLIAPSMDVVDQHWEFIGVFYHPDNYEGQRRVGEPWATDGLWEMHGEMSSHGHVAAYPVEIPSRNIKLYTDPGDTVMDPFLGAGTTLIACEELGRRCVGLELSPHYCDVIVRRWEQFTGKTATRETPALHEAAD